MILYHGSNVTVEKPVLVKQNRFLHTVGEEYLMNDIDEYIAQMQN